MAAVAFQVLLLRRSNLELPHSTLYTRKEELQGIFFFSPTKKQFILKQMYILGLKYLKRISQRALVLNINSH